MNVQQDASARKSLAPDPTIASVVPAYLREMRRWTAWRLAAPKRAGDKPAKFPLSLTNDAKTWKSFAEALAVGQGIGFMMLGTTTVVGLDLDSCVNDDGSLSPFATSLVEALPDTYAELSPSGKGLRLFAQMPDGMKAPPEFLARQHGVECYIGRSARFLTVTGRALPGRAGAWGFFTDAAAKMLVPLAATVGGGLEIEVKIPTPTVARQEEWGKLFDKRCTFMKLGAALREYLANGDIPGARSEKTFAIACRLLEARYGPEEVFTILISAPGSWEAALDKRDQDVVRARELIWSDIGRAQKILRAEDKGSQERMQDWSALGLKTQIIQKRLTVLTTQMNALRVLTNADAWRGRLALDITSGGVLLDEEPLDDGRFFQLQEEIAQFCAWQKVPQRQWWTDLVRAAAEKNPINPRAAYLRSLTWDNVPRLEEWFTRCVTLTDTPLMREIGKKFLVGCAARWLNPGVKHDTVLILQGPEGARKNTLFEVIAGDTTRVKPLEGFEKDDKFTVAKAWIVEMPESYVLRKGDRNRLKAFVTRPNDDYRPPYAATPGCFLRGWVLVATANPGHLFAADQDGLRRFWPVQVRRRIDYEWVAEHRDQLLAEAVAYLDAAPLLGDESPWWFEETPKELADIQKAALEQTAIDDALETLIEQHVGKGGLRLSDIIAEIGVILGERPSDRVVTPLLEKHGLRPRRVTTHRFWIHPSWARPGVAGEADIIPLRQVKPVGKPEDVLS